jgi:hypothetical protein
MTEAPSTSLPPENLQRGVIFALIALPVGVIAWDIIWSVGFIASIVAFGVAYLAARLYRLGSGGRVTRSGAIAITAVTIGTLIIAFISGFAIDVIGEYTRITGESVTEALLSSRFWSIVFADMTDPQSLISVLLAAAFGVLGCFSILRGAFRQTRVAPPAVGGYELPAADQTVPAPPAAPSGMVLNGEPVAPMADESGEGDKKK